MRNKKELIFIHIAVIFTVAFYIFITNFLNIGCPFRKFTNIPCPGCGLTRSAFYLLKLDIKKSLFFHPLTLIILPSIFIVIHSTLFPFSRISAKAKNIFTALLLILILGVYFLRLYLGIIP